MQSKNTSSKNRKLLDQSPEIVRRWTAIKLAAKAPALARMYMRWRLPLRERRRREALESAFNAIRDQAIRCEREGYATSLVIFNIALYLLLAERDIQTLKIDALTHPDEWTRKLCARVILLTIHEWDMDKVTGTALKKALEEIGAPAPLRNEAVQSLRSLRLVQKAAKKNFSFLRNSTIAHRDANALTQYRAIRHLKVDEVMATAIEFFKGAERFIAVLPRIILASNAFPVLLRQLAASQNGRMPMQLGKE